MPDQLRLISHPFHNGLQGVDMAAGPLRLLAEADRRLARLVRAAVAEGAFDTDGRMARAALDLIGTIGREALRQ